MAEHLRKPHNAGEADVEVTFSHPSFYIYIQYFVCYLRSSLGWGRGYAGVSTDFNFQITDIKKQ